jgi:Flp pilus assembly protein TadG
MPASHPPTPELTFHPCLTTAHQREVTPLRERVCRRVFAVAVAQRAAAMVEFTLVLPVLLLILMAILVVGQAFNESIDETHLVDVAARYAAVNQNPGSGTLQAYIASQADTADLKAASVCISFPSGTANIGDPVQVRMTSTYQWIPLLSTDVFGGASSVQLVRTATMRLEAVPTVYSAGC